MTELLIECYIDVTMVRYDSIHIYDTRRAKKLNESYMCDFLPLKTRFDGKFIDVKEPATNFDKLIRGKGKQSMH